MGNISKEFSLVPVNFYNFNKFTRFLEAGLNGTVLCYVT